MFFGKILSQGQSYKFSPDQAQASQGQVLSLTNVVLAPTSKDSATLWIKKDNEEFLIASLSKANSHAAINVFISLLDQVTLLVKGNGSIHIAGFFEPDQHGDLPLGEQELQSEQDQQEDEDQEEEEEEQQKPVAPASKLAVPTKAPQKAASPLQKPQSPQQKAQSPQQKAQAPSKAAAKKVVQEDSDDDEDLDDEDLDDDELDELDDDLEDEEQDEDEDQDEDQDEIEAPPAKHIKQDTNKPQSFNKNAGKPQHGGKPNFQQGGRPNKFEGKQNFQQGGKPNFNKGGNKPWNNGNNQNKGGKPWNNQNKGGNKPWNNQNKGGNKPFNKGGKNFQKH